MRSFLFSKYDATAEGKTPFEQLLNLFLQLLTYTSGDIAEALSWLTELDKEYKLNDGEYGIGDFIEDLKDKGYLDEDPASGEIHITPKTEQSIRKRSLEEIFGKLKKSRQGNHPTYIAGQGDEPNADTRPYRFGDTVEQIDFTSSIRNAQINHGMESFQLAQDDLEIRETDLKTQTSTVLMIDISHSMILYGEDRITPGQESSYGIERADSDQVPERYP
jgi:uncharacterized protein with von Willebrand factor type A (vWA) domain